MKKKKRKTHRIDLEIYKFGEYWGYQCSCGELVEKFDKHKKVMQGPKAQAG